MKDRTEAGSVVSKESALENHRKLWMWIHDETLSRQYPVKDKNEYFECTGEERVCAGCYLCNYAAKVGNGGDLCSKCLVKWPNNDELGVNSCTNEEGTGMIDLLHDEDDYKMFAWLAKQIAELPER